VSAGEIEFKFLGSRAAAMLADALQAAHDRGVSQRTLAKRLNYK
jgi:hypothetical protein